MVIDSGIIYSGNFCKIQYEIHSSRYRIRNVYIQTTETFAPLEMGNEIFISRRARHSVSFHFSFNFSPRNVMSLGGWDGSSCEMFNILFKQLKSVGDLELRIFVLLGDDCSRRVHSGGTLSQNESTRSSCRKSQYWFTC